MNAPHKHKDLIIAWADGAQTEYYDENYRNWYDAPNPAWDKDTQYRIKQKKATITFTQTELDVIKSAVNYYTNWVVSRNNQQCVTVVEILDKIEGAMK